MSNNEHEPATVSVWDLPQRKQLIEWADAANRLHDRVIHGLRTTVKQAREAGQYLNHAKAVVPHGLWGPWLAEFFHASHETAIVYMRIDREWRVLAPRVNAVGSFGTSKVTLCQLQRILREEKAKKRAACEPCDGPQPAGAPAGPGEEHDQPLLAELEQAADGLADAFRDSLKALDRFELLFWSRFLHGDGIAAFIKAKAAEIHLVARVVIKAYWRWQERARVEPDVPSAEWEELFRMEVWRQFHRRENSTRWEKEVIYELVREVKGLRGKPEAFVNLQPNGDPSAA